MYGLWNKIIGTSENMSLQTIQKEYERYGFSDFEKWNKEFEFSGIEVDKWDFLNSFCRLVSGKLSKFIGYTTPLFLPGSSYAAIIQGGVKDKALVEESKQLYKELMVLYHQSIKIEMLSEKEQVQFIKSFLKKYFSLKKRVLVLLDVCQEVFRQDSLEKKVESKGYLG